MPDSASDKVAVLRSRRSRQRAGRFFARRAVLLALLLVFLGGIWWWANGRKLAVSPSLMAKLRGKSYCDVLVVGGTPSGVAAALAAARRGASVVLIEERPQIGGDIVHAMLNMFDVPVRPGSQKSPIAHGIFGEFYNQLGLAFDIDRARILMEKALDKEPNITWRTQTRAVRLRMQENRLIGATLRTKNGQAEEWEAGITIDATEDASVAARAGCGFYLGRENANPDKKMQAAGLLFSVKNVDWNAVLGYTASLRTVKVENLKKWKRGGKKAIDVKIHRTSNGQKSAVLRLGGGVGDYAWERGDVIKGYVPHGPNIMVLSINFGRQSDGSVVLNTLNIVGVNGLSRFSKKAAYEEASREVPLLIEYLRHRMPGFQNAKLDKIAPELYIRETRHIHGYYALKVFDIRHHTRFDDRVGLASYPLDLHPYNKGDTNPFGPTRYYYTLPIRSLVPRRINGLFVASRSLSATYSAAGSVRVVPATMTAGEAAGAAAVLCLEERILPHNLMDNEVWIAQLQDSLREGGADVGDKWPKLK